MQMTHLGQALSFPRDAADQEVDIDTLCTWQSQAFGIWLVACQSWPPGVLAAVQSEVGFGWGQVRFTLGRL